MGHHAKSFSVRDTHHFLQFLRLKPGTGKISVTFERNDPGGHDLDKISPGLFNSLRQSAEFLRIPPAASHNGAVVSRFMDGVNRSDHFDTVFCGHFPSDAGDAQGVPSVAEINHPCFFQCAEFRGYDVSVRTLLMHGAGRGIIRASHHQMAVALKQCFFHDSPRFHKMIHK